MNMIKLAIGTPAYRGVIASGHSKMWLQIGACLVRNDEHIQMHAMADLDLCGIDQARNTLLDIARAAKCDWLFMIDSDTWVDPGSDIIRMIVEAESHGAAIVGAPVVVRGVGGPINVQKYDPESERHSPISVNSLPGVMAEVDAVGAAVMAINVARVGGARFAFTEVSSEDIGFCRQVKKSGGKVLVDPRVRTRHVNKPEVLTYQIG